MAVRVQPPLGSNSLSFPWPPSPPAAACSTRTSSPATPAARSQCTRTGETRAQGTLSRSEQSREMQQCAPASPPITTLTCSKGTQGRPPRVPLPRQRVCATYENRHRPRHSPQAHRHPAPLKEHRLRLAHRSRFLSTAQAPAHPRSGSASRPTEPCCRAIHYHTETRNPSSLVSRPFAAQAGTSVFTSSASSRAAFIHILYLCSNMPHISPALQRYTRDMKHRRCR